MKFHPMNGYVICEKRQREETYSDSDIVIPESARDEFPIADVITVHDDSELQPGDTILIDKFTGEEIEITDEEKILLVREKEILAKVEEE